MKYFISYSRMELTFADSLAQELKARGIEAWLDTYQLVPGIDWQQQICDAIRAASTVLVVASQESLASANCQLEIATAQALDKDIILLQVDNAIYSQPVPEDWDRVRHCLNEQKPVVDWQRLQACKRIHFGGSFEDALAALIDSLSRESYSAARPGARYPTGVERLLTLRRLWFWFGAVWLVLLLFSLTAVESARALNADPWLGDNYLAYRLFDLDMTQTLLLSLIVAGLVIMMLVWTVRVTRKIRVRAHRFWPTLFNTILSPLVLCLAGALTLTNIQFGATTMLRYSESLRRADEAAFQMPGYLQPLNEQIATPLFLASAVLAMIVVYTMLRLLGGRDLYRWAGTYGVLLSEFHGWEHFGPSTSRLILPGVILVPLCGLMGLSGTLIAVISILLGFAALVGVTWLILIPAIRITGRSAADYRRHWAADSAGGRVRVALDSAPQDSALVKRFEKALSKYHDITSLEQANIVVTLLSTHKRTTAAHPSQTVIPVLLDGRFPQPEEDDRLSRLQTIDRRRSVANQTLDSFAQLLNRPAQLAAALGNFPRKLSAAEQRPQAVNTMTWILRGLQIALVVLTGYVVFSVVFAQPLPEPVAQELAEMREEALQDREEGDSYFPQTITHFGAILPDYWHVVFAQANDWNLREFGALEAIIDESGVYEIEHWHAIVYPSRSGYGSSSVAPYGDFEIEVSEAGSVRAVDPRTYDSDGNYPIVDAPLSHPLLLPARVAEFQETLLQALAILVPLVLVTELAIRALKSRRRGLRLYLLAMLILSFYPAVAIIYDEWIYVVLMFANWIMIPVLGYVLVSRQIRNWLPPILPRPGVTRAPAMAQQPQHG